MEAGGLCEAPRLRITTVEWEDGKTTTAACLSGALLEGISRITLQDARRKTEGGDSALHAAAGKHADSGE